MARLLGGPLSFLAQMRALLVVEFDYAGSIRGEPSVTIALNPVIAAQKDVVFLLTDLAVRTMAQEGRAYHGLEAMPSNDAEDYRIVVADRLLTQGSLAEVVQIAGLVRAVAKLVYVGPWGEEQQAQALALGGESSLETARRHVEQARRWRRRWT